MCVCVCVCVCMSMSIKNNCKQAVPPNNKLRGTICSEKTCSISKMAELVKKKCYNMDPI